MQQHVVECPGGGSVHIRPNLLVVAAALFTAQARDGCCAGEPAHARRLHARLSRRLEQPLRLLKLVLLPLGLRVKLLPLHACGVPHGRRPGTASERVLHSESFSLNPDPYALSTASERALNPGT